MTNQDVLKIAMEQSAYDCGCNANDFLKTTNVIVPSYKNERARKYLSLPFECNLVSYGNNIVASVSEELSDVANRYISRFAAEHCFETPNMHILNGEMEKRGLRICFMAEYFLPDVEHLKELPCKYETRILHQSDFSQLYTSEWSNALCKDRRQLDVLGVGAYEGQKLIGLAGCSADCDTMYQIGVDVLPDYRKQGIAAALTSKLALEIFKLSKVPFYCAAWSNIKSVRNAIRSSFRPSWVEMTVKSIEFTEKLI